MRQVSALRVWVGSERQVPDAFASAQPWFVPRSTSRTKKAAEDYETISENQRAGIHLDSDGALANLLLPCLSLLAARMAVVAPLLHICPSPPFWRTSPAGVSSGPIILPISLIFHHSWLELRCASCRGASPRRALSPPLPPHSILTLKEKRRPLKGGYSRTRRASVSGEKQELKKKKSKKNRSISREKMTTRCWGDFQKKISNADILTQKNMNENINENITLLTCRGVMLLSTFTDWKNFHLKHLKSLNHWIRLGKVFSVATRTYPLPGKYS